MDWLNKIHIGDCRSLLPQMLGDGIRARMCVTSPPYFGLRDYGMANQLGQELTPQEYVRCLITTLRSVRDILTDDGTLWLNLGDSYRPVNRGENAKPRKDYPSGMQAAHMHSDLVTNKARIRAMHESGLKDKDLLGIPWRVAFALQDDGWYLRQDIIWSKPNPVPESVRDRCTKSHEYLFLLSKSRHYYFDADAIKEPTTESTRSRLAQNVDAQASSYRVPGKTNGAMKARGNPVKRNRRSVWTINTKPYKGAHFAVFPPQLVEPCIRAGSAPGDVILDPFIGSGTTAGVALMLSRQFIGCDLNPSYAALHGPRIQKICAA